MTIHFATTVYFATLQVARPSSALVVVDVQNDFISGSLPVPGAAEIIEGVESLTKLDIWYQVGGATSSSL